MVLKDFNIETVSFSEFVTNNSKNTKTSSFDIIINHENDLDNYCNALLSKFFELSISNYDHFISYQINSLINPCKWLNKLDLLVTKNKGLFKSKDSLFRYTEIFILIEKKQLELKSSNKPNSIICTPKKYVNAESDDRHFSFFEIKKQLVICQTDEEKILLLTKEMFEYQQASIEFINQKTPMYDAQCAKEIEHIYALQKLQAAVEQTKREQNQNQLPFKKMQINCNLNQFIDIHYQFLRELFVDGKSILDGSINDMVAIIVNSYLDKDGKDISPETVKTILTPSRTEKRPKPHKRIDIDKML